MAITDIDLDEKIVKHVVCVHMRSTRHMLVPGWCLKIRRQKSIALSLITIERKRFSDTCNSY